MTAKTFEQEALEFVLDGDSVQALVAVAESDWHLDRATALREIRQLAAVGLLQTYEHDEANNQDIDVEAGRLTLDDVGSGPPIWFARTERTIPRLKHPLCRAGAAGRLEGRAW